MRRVFLSVVALALLAAACASSSSTTASGNGSTQPPATASDCASNVTLSTPGQLTIGTDNPAYPPYFSGGESKTHPEWKFNDPYADKGFEDAVAYEAAGRMGFSPDHVQWVVAPFNQTYKPGAKGYDFAIEQISYSAKRAQAVDFSESYYDVNQALVARKGSPIASATGIADLKKYTLAAPLGTSSYDFITNTVMPDKQPGAYNTLNDTVQAFNAGQVDGIIVDLPTALYMADPFVQEAKDSTVVAQFPTAAAGEYFGMTLEKGSPLTACINQALDEMKADGTLADITQTWLSKKTNVGEVPVFST